MALNISNTQTVTPLRVVDEANNIREPIAPIEVVVFIGAAEPESGDRSKGFSQSGTLWTHRGADLRDADEVPLQQGLFGVVGGPGLDQDHPMTGTDFGWVRYTIRRGG